MSDQEGVITVIIDCQTCPVRDLHCDDCMVTALQAPSGAGLRLDAAERLAVSRFGARGQDSGEEAATVQARPEPWSPHVRAVG